MNAIEAACAEQRFDSQLGLVREHWASVRRLWLSDSDLDPGGHIRSSLPPDFWIGAGMPGLADVKPTRDGRFEFTEDGRVAVIVPCYDPIPGMLDANPERHVEHLVDLVAVDLDRPDWFWRRRGEALILGAAYLDLAAEYGEPLPVFSTPITWLKSGGAGIVILDWEWVPELLVGFELIAGDVDLGSRLEAALKPEIWVMRTAA